MFETEKDSIDFTIQFLEKRGFKNIIPTQESDRFCYYDLQAEKNDKKYRFEVKRRKMDSTVFNDAIIEQYKYDKFIDSLNKKEIDYACLITYFTDCITVSNISKPKYKFNALIQHQTEFNDHNKINKNIISYNQDKKYEYCDYQ